MIDEKTFVVVIDDQGGLDCVVVTKAQVLRFAKKEKIKKEKDMLYYYLEWTFSNDYSNWQVINPDKSNLATLKKVVKNVEKYITENNFEQKM